MENRENILHFKIAGEKTQQFYLIFGCHGAKAKHSFDGPKHNQNNKNNNRHQRENTLKQQKKLESEREKNKQMHNECMAYYSK